MALFRSLLVLLLVLRPDGAVSGAPPPPGPIPRLPYRILHRYPHAVDASTQGLLLHRGRLYESTGGYGRSELRISDIATGRVLSRHRLARRYFGEGLALHRGSLFQLTWREHTGFVYDAGSLLQTGTFTYTHEGWGITSDGDNLLISDGGSTLRVLDPHTLAPRDRIAVHADNRPVTELNELEYVSPFIYANIWHSDLIARINPDSGAVVAWIDCAPLSREAAGSPGAGVLNGIAHDPTDDTLLVTGKNWPLLFRIRLVDDDPATPEGRDHDAAP
ncbi:MAG: glutaminyl-peptide cyclotransferase [Thermodesulfobacteriota bacterium]